MTTTFENAKVGDKVWHLEYGWGAIVDVSIGDYPLAVDFENEYYEVVKRFTFEGTFRLSPFTQTLFWDEIKIVAPSKPLPNLPVDTKVLVWNNGTDKLPRHFSRFDESGKIECYLEGQTSWSTDGGTSYWENWELAE